MTETLLRYTRLFHGDRPAYAAVDASGAARLLTDAPWHGGKPSGVVLDAEALQSPNEMRSPGKPPLCPVQPSKIIGIGRNYRKHAEELRNEVPEEPLMFFKPPSSLLPHGGNVLLPRESARVDYEGELVVVLGQRCRRLTRAAAERAIFGYSIACDVTARDLQTKDKQWTRAKGFDTFCPLGPHVVALPEASALGIKLSLNGKLMQDGNTRDMLFDVPSLIAYASQSMTLEPGDVILTGTPEGVGPLAEGDRAVIAIDGLGELSFSVRGEG